MGQGGEVLDLSQLQLVTTISPAARAAAAAVDPWAAPLLDDRALRDAIASAVGRARTEIFVGRGAEGVLEALYQVLTQDGDRVVTCSPSWPSVTRAALVAGARYVDLGRDQHMRPRLDNLARILEDQRPRLAVLADPDPVTGTPVPAELYAHLRAAGVTAVVDRSCAPLSGRLDATAEAVASYASGTQGGQAPAIILVDSLSVRGGLGADPVGWAVAPPGVIDALRRAFPHSRLSGLARAAALASLQAPAELERAARSWTERRQRLEAALEEVRRGLATESPDASTALRVSSSRGPALWLGCRGVSAEGLAQALWREGVRVAAQPQDPAWHDGVSLVAPPKEHLPRALRALRRALRGLCGTEASDIEASDTEANDTEANDTEANDTVLRGPVGRLGRTAGLLLALALPLGLLATMGSAAGCGEPSPPTQPARQTTRAADAALAAPSAIHPAPPATAPATGKAPATGGSGAQRRVPKGVWKPLHRAPVVGGCGRACTNPRDALVGFLAGLAGTAASSARERAVSRFLNTAELQVDGRSQGEALARLWQSGQLDLRRRRLEALIRDLGRGLPPEARAALAEAAAAAPLSVGPRTASATVEVPPLGSQWRVSLARRGLEWLVVAVDRR